MTASELLAILTSKGFAPAVDGEDLVLAADAPPLLVSKIELLATGVRALLTGRRWYGLDGRTGRFCGPFPLKSSGPFAFGALDPSMLLPRGVSLLQVGGDREWDRLTPWVVEDLPDCFEPPPLPPRPRPPGGPKGYYP